MYSAIRLKISSAGKGIKRVFTKNPRMKFLFGWHYKHGSIKENQILFESFHGKDVSDSPMYILKELLKSEDFKKYIIYFSTNNYKEHSKFIKAHNLPVKLLPITSYSYPKILATSKFLINNSSFPVYFIRKDDQIYLQTWHGTPLKTLGKRMRYGMESMYSVQHNFIQASHLLFPNEFTRDVIMDDYNLNSLITGKVVMCGYPRNTIFFDSQKAKKVCRELENESYTTFAYMPTWRGKSSLAVQMEDQKVRLKEMLEYLDSHLLDHQKLYVNFHPIVQRSVELDTYKHILPFPADIDKYEFLNSVDVLITDYSSVFFDFSITGKPIILFMYDFEEYISDRGVYFDIQQLPFHKIYRLCDLKDCIVQESYNEKGYSDDQQYRQKFLSHESPDNGKRISKLIFENKCENLSVTDYSMNRQKLRTVFFPSGVRTVGDIDAIVRVANRERDIIVFEKKFFNAGMSSHLHDNYKDDFDYVFLTHTAARTFLEEFLGRWNPKIRGEVKQREVKRCFGNLNIKPQYIKEYYHGEMGERYYIQKICSVPVSWDVKAGNLEMEIKEQHKYHIGKILIADKARNILWTRVLSDDEKRTGIIHEGFREFAGSGIVKAEKEYRLALEGNLGDSSKLVLYYPKCERNAQNSSGQYLKPIVLENVVLDTGETNQGMMMLPKSGSELTFAICRPERVGNKLYKGSIARIKMRGCCAVVEIDLKADLSKIKAVVLKGQCSGTDKSYFLDYKIEDAGTFLRVAVEFDMSMLEKGDCRWNFGVLLEEWKEEFFIELHCDKWKKLSLLLHNYECRERGGMIYAPILEKGRLAFISRPATPFDGRKPLLKSMAAFAAYKLLKNSWKERKIWLIYESDYLGKQSSFFQYCMEEPDVFRSRRIYLVLNKGVCREKKYGKNSIRLMSFRYILYSLSASVYVIAENNYIDYYFKGTLFNKLYGVLGDIPEKYERNEGSDDEKLCKLIIDKEK